MALLLCMHVRKTMACLCEVSASPLWISCWCYNSKDIQLRLIGYYKLPVGVSVSVKGCLSQGVRPVIVWQPVKAVLCPMSAWLNDKHLLLMD